jgi:hypothetical protein
VPDDRDVRCGAAGDRLVPPGQGPGDELAEREEVHARLRVAQVAGLQRERELGVADVRVQP